MKVTKATMRPVVPPQLALTTKTAVKMRRAKVMEFGRFTTWPECGPVTIKKQPFAIETGRFDKRSDSKLRQGHEEASPKIVNE